MTNEKVDCITITDYCKMVNVTKEKFFTYHLPVLLLLSYAGIRQNNSIAIPQTNGLDMFVADITTNKMSLKEAYMKRINK